jgi:hypothetical protein
MRGEELGVKVSRGKLDFFECKYENSIVLRNWELLALSSTCSCTFGTNFDHSYSLHNHAWICIC